MSFSCGGFGREYLFVIAAITVDDANDNSLNTRRLRNGNTKAEGQTDQCLPARINWRWRDPRQTDDSLSRRESLGAPTCMTFSSNGARVPSLVSSMLFLLLTLGASGALLGCGGGGSEAQRRGVGAACASNDDCTEAGQSCLAFKGGYCGLANCKVDAGQNDAGQNDVGCPPGSACVAHTDGKNYCFLVCTDKPQCNLYRAVEVEANCSSNVTFVDGTLNIKACVPPSS
jgi:hypothetical protein